MINKEQQDVADVFMDNLSDFFQKNDAVQSKIRRCIETRSSEVSRLLDDYQLDDSQISPYLNPILANLEPHFQNFTAKSYIHSLLCPIVEQIFNEDKTNLSERTIQALGPEVYDNLLESLGQQKLNEGFFASILMWYSQTIEDSLAKQTPINDNTQLLTQLRLGVITQDLSLQQFKVNPRIENQWPDTKDVLFRELQELDQDINQGLAALGTDDILSKKLLNIKNTHTGIDWHQLSFDDSNTYRYLASSHLYKAYKELAGIPLSDLSASGQTVLLKILDTALSRKLAYAIRLLNQHPADAQKIKLLLYTPEYPNESLFTQQDLARLPLSLQSKLVPDNDEDIRVDLEQFKTQIDRKPSGIWAYLSGSKTTAAVFIVGTMIGLGLTFSGIFTPLGVGLLAGLYLALITGSATATTKSLTHYTYSKITDNVKPVGSSTGKTLSSLHHKHGKAARPETITFETTTSSAKLFKTPETKRPENQKKKENQTPSQK